MAQGFEYHVIWENDSEFKLIHNSMGNSTHPCFLLTLFLIFYIYYNDVIEKIQQWIIKLDGRDWFTKFTRIIEFTNETTPIYTYIYRGRIKYKPMNYYKLCKPLYQEIVELFIDTYHGSLIEPRYIQKLIIFIHYDYDFIL